MNLIEENFQTKEEKNKKMTTKIILVAIVLVIAIIIGIVSYLMYVQSTALKVTLDGKLSDDLKKMLVFEENGKIYVPIKEVAKLLEYDSYNGEYEEKSESKSKCYVESINKTEAANFVLGSTIIYKKDLTQKNAEYEYAKIKEPVKAINGVLYTTTEGIEEGFNVSFQYDKANNKITVYTLPYLVKAYAGNVLNYGYVDISETFSNQKAILDGMIVVAKGENSKKYGVIGLDGKTTILDAKYDNITYLPNVGDFLVETDRKVGILSKEGKTKVQIIYDSIALMDSDTALYVVSRDEKYGVIDTNGTIKIHIENEQIGIDKSKFEKNDIRNRYLLFKTLIPVQKGQKWGIYDKDGNQVVDFNYDSFGYITSTNKTAYNLLVIPDYNVLVACKDKKYTLLNSSGKELFAPIADDIYMTISGGKKYYYINVNDKTYNAEEYLNSIGVKRAIDENIGTVSDSRETQTQTTENDKKTNDTEHKQESNNEGNDNRNDDNEEEQNENNDNNNEEEQNENNNNNNEEEQNENNDSNNQE